MNLALDRAAFFVHDFELQAAWYVREADGEVARRYLQALDATLAPFRAPDRRDWLHAVSGARLLLSWGAGKVCCMITTALASPMRRAMPRQPSTLSPHHKTFALRGRQPPPEIGRFPHAVAFTLGQVDLLRQVLSDTLKDGHQTFCSVSTL
jgi:hypothetical protein